MQWYFQARGKHAHPTREGLDQYFSVRVELCIFQPPARLKIPILVHLEAVNDDIPTEVEVEMAVRGLKLGEWEVRWI